MAMGFGHVLTGGGSIQAVWDQRQARDASNFSRDMASTAYQMTVADMKAAGLNPVLAAKFGGGSNPQGQASRAPGPQPFDPVSSALAWKKAKADIDLVKSQAKQSDMLAWKAQEDASLTTRQNRLLMLQMAGAEAEQAIDKSEFGKIMRGAARIPGVGVLAPSALRLMRGK